MDLRAYWGTASVHLAGLVLATMSFGAAPAATNCCGAGAVGYGNGGSGATNRPGTEPARTVRLFLVSNQEPRPLFTTFTLRASTLDPGEMRCPENGVTDRDAAVLPRAPNPALLNGLRLNGENPAVCILIGRDGRATEAYIARRSGDPAEDDALLRAIRSIPFAPAQRSGAAVAAWHRLIVNRPLGLEVVAPSSADPPPQPFHYAL